MCVSSQVRINPGSLRSRNSNFNNVSTLFANLQSLTSGFRKLFLQDLCTRSEWTTTEKVRVGRESLKLNATHARGTTLQHATGLLDHLHSDSTDDGPGGHQP